MSLPWFRLYAEIVDDEVLQFLAFGDQRHYVWILSLKCMGLLDKPYPKDDMRDAIIARKLGLQGEAFTNAKQRLLEVGLIDENWQPTGWNKRQFISDQDVTNAGRQKKYRERKRNVTRNVTVTRPDTDTDTEQNIGAKRATQPPKEFPIPEDLKTWAKEQGLKTSTLEKETEKFLDYHRAKGSTFKDWNAAWRKWMRNAKEWAKDKPVENMFEGAL